MLAAVGFFFFSSRRRHTIFDCDWSSDVCSSDLGGEPLDVVVASEPAQRPATAPCADWPLAGLGGKVRGTLYQLNQRFEFWTTDIGAYRIDPETGRIEMPACDDHLDRKSVV